MTAVISNKAFIKAVRCYFCDDGSSNVIAEAGRSAGAAAHFLFGVELMSKLISPPDVISSCVKKTLSNEFPFSVAL